LRLECAVALRRRAKLDSDSEGGPWWDHPKGPPHRRGVRDPSEPVGWAPVGTTPHTNLVDYGMNARRLEQALGALGESANSPPSRQPLSRGKGIASGPRRFDLQGGEHSSRLPYPQAPRPSTS
jgi:hypothetical protein